MSLRELIAGLEAVKSVADKDKEVLVSGGEVVTGVALVKPENQVMLTTRSFEKCNQPSPSA